MGNRANYEKKYKIIHVKADNTEERLEGTVLEGVSCTVPSSSLTFISQNSGI